MTAPKPAPPQVLPAEARRRRVAALVAQGRAPHQIAHLVGVSRGQVQRDIKRAAEQGLLPPRDGGGPR